jgi:PadR family transcriptional regulator AphA
MSLRHILLGMLREPASGYDIKQSFSHSVAHFWTAELSQIYPALARLEQDQLVASKVVPSEKGPDRKVYSRTSAGRRELRNWLMDGPNCRQDRITFLTQVFFLEAIPMASRLRFMRDLKADFEAHLEELQAVEEHWHKEDPRYPDDLPDEYSYRQMTLSLGIKRYKATIKWCEQCIERMAKRQESD